MCDTLAQTHRMGEPNEWLHDECVRDVAMEQSWEEIPPVRRLAEALAMLKQDENGVFATKLMWEQFEERLRSAAVEEPESTLCLGDLFPSSRFVFITRKDKIAQAISWSRAEKTGVWHHVQGLTKPLRAAFDFVQIEHFRRRIEENEAGWRALFAKEGLEVYDVEYEAFRSEPERSAATLLKFLGLGSEADVPSLESRTRIASDSINRAWRQTYIDLRALAEARAEAGLLRPLPDEACKAELFSEQTRHSMVSGEKRSLEVTLTNRSEHSWPRIGAPDGSLWLRVAAFWQPASGAKGKHNPDLALLPCDVQAGEQVKVEILLTAPQEPGDYSLVMDIYEEGHPSFSDRGSPILRHSVQVQPRDEAAAVAHHFGDYSMLADIWVQCPWFGNFTANLFPWIYHQHHGWLFCDGQGKDADEFLFMDAEFGWWGTSSSEYPSLTRLETGQRFRFFADRSNAEIRRFQDTQTLQWMKVPRNEPDPDKSSTA